MDPQRGLGAGRRRSVVGHVLLAVAMVCLLLAGMAMRPGASGGAPRPNGGAPTPQEDVSSSGQVTDVETSTREGEPLPSDSARAGAAPASPAGAIPGAETSAGEDSPEAPSEDELGETRTTGGLTAPVPASASGSLVVVSRERAALAKGAPLTYRVEVEEGLPIDGEAFAAAVHSVVNDQRGWPRAFTQVSDGGMIQVVLASPDLVDRLCAPLKTRGRLSCQRGSRAVINAVRWQEGAEPFLQAGGTRADYRRYLLNHEIGHLLSEVHVPCSGPGEPAPVMMQQTLSVGECEPNPWPRPDRARVYRGD
ncbi:MAG: DUF3152 domain-containing protein [Bowdeniella nasicola]|nr:DUF3152 domain-containing protein [Bowdeniella nasicola]